MMLSHTKRTTNGNEKSLYLSTQSCILYLCKVWIGRIRMDESWPSHTRGLFLLLSQDDHILPWAWNLCGSSWLATLMNSRVIFLFQILSFSWQKRQKRSKKGIPLFRELDKVRFPLFHSLFFPVFFFDEFLLLFSFTQLQNEKENLYHENRYSFLFFIISFVKYFVTLLLRLLSALLLLQVFIFS